MSEDLPEPSGLDRAAAVMRDVRDRCVWTQQMTHEELVPYLVEESSEVIEAVETGTRTDLREELGDLLWQVLFHAEISARAGEFDIDDVANDLSDKMVRRHPHVFAGETARTPEEVLVHWNAAKAAEKRERRSVLDGIPAAMPALARAQKVLGRASSVGVGASAPTTEPADEAQLGEALLALAARAREHGWDAERALRGSMRELEARVREAETGR
ncbi:MazG family protein [Microbacterium sp. ZW T5_56]|uniref:MazG family protein n=1 Tax=Microbacterium sp. ZW T5_56 TaxID=3378081 RepID=UPI0038533D09